MVNTFKEGIFAGVNSNLTHAQIFALQHPGITQKVSINTTGEDIERVKLIISLLSGRAIYEEPGLSVYRLNNTSILEIYSPGACYPGYLFKDSNISVSFQVADLDITINELKGRSVTILSGIIKVCDSLSYCHLRLNNGIVIGLYQEGDKLLS